MSTEILEGYPDTILERLDKREQSRRTALPSRVNGISLELVLEDLKLWQVGVLTVSFKGGTTILHKQIADAASEWTNHGNIRFDFGYNENSGTFRQWTPTDASHIRVGFQHKGYWSLVGTDSKDETIVSNGEITLNLRGFDQQLPPNWKGTVLHEFGHALGFHHEHQSPNGNCDFDWDKLYEHLAKPPNEWDRAKVDHNLRKLPGGGLTYSPHDLSSIMHYSFPAWMFKSGNQSPCFTTQNNTLSPMDKKMMGQAYPVLKPAFEMLTDQRIKNLEVILSNSSRSVKTNEHFHRHLEYLKKDKKAREIFE